MTTRFGYHAGDRNHGQGDTHDKRWHEGGWDFYKRFPEPEDPEWNGRFESDLAKISTLATSSTLPPFPPIELDESSWYRAVDEVRRRRNKQQPEPGTFMIGTRLI